MFGKSKQIERPYYVFECDLICSNCGFEWTEEFEKGDEVIQEGTKIMVGDGKKGIAIHCYNCSSSNVEVTKRKPKENAQRNLG